PRQPSSPLFPYTTLFRSSSPGYPVSDQATETNTDITATSETVGGMTGGFDPNLALAPGLQQQVSSTNGLPLDDTIPGRYPVLWRSEEHTSELQSRENLVC